MNDFFSLKFENDYFIFIDQTRLPLEEIYIETDNYERIAEAIERLEIRGAPAIGIATAFGITVALKNILSQHETQFNIAYERLKRTRPTAVNLFWALDEMKKVFQLQNNFDDIYDKLKARAFQIHNEDIISCDKIGENGIELLENDSVILTHCNTGQLATGGSGTAFSVLKKGFEAGKVKFVYADETRPLLQGSRLTAFELSKSNIPFEILPDSAAAFLMKQRKIDAVIVGADRIAKNGDTANKIGTYNLAILCNYYKIPFYIAAPTSTIDFSIDSGDEIKIEMRGSEEISHIRGIKVTKEEYATYTPAFDVTPNELITAIITDKQVCKPPFDL
ncbi:MAG: S-methyl-5-thioribose-1-phosphate isomerase [Bacteroidetes bacterium]|nr:S-methyl-5-thioribose-1-phosphate isomerase [Bacteroidota bacterium]MBU1116133.1 S-methyl-5-thioribose-1-phosphate isomerase [Bacteroidota bacterium]MBU1800425.1 S-methyl-5-thioribose-1-phosphate isomerase [Bacteroidota bacterium]